MRTLILTLCVLALGLTSNAQTDKQKRYMTENAPATASRLKYYWPDSVIEALLPNLPGETWQKRLFIFSMANVESPGGLVSAKIQKGTSDDVFGILQIKQIRLQHYFDNIKMTPYCSAADLADVTKPDSVTMLLPLKILNDAVAFYKLDNLKNYRIVLNRLKFVLVF